MLAHSDGDVALHALTDALLGAAALGDIGKLFPDTDPAFKGADSRELLREAWRRIQAKGYALGNVDVTIIAQAPKMLPHIPQMRVFIAEDLGCHMDDVNVKATTTENWDLPDVGKGLPVKRWRYSLRQQMIEFDNLTYLHGKPQGTGLLKANPEDFVVVEDLGFEPDGEGEHILVRILKTVAIPVLWRMHWRNS